MQEPIPIWVVGAWPRAKSMRRVLRCDGVVPQYESGEDGPDGLRDVRAWLTDHGAASEFDVISEGETPGDDRVAAEAMVRPWREAGATWWLETNWEMPHNSPERMAQIRRRIEAGPPG